MDDLRKTIELAKQQLEKMIDLNPQVMLLIDKEGRVTRTNKALLDLLRLPGYPAVLDKHLNELLPGNEVVSKLLLRKQTDETHETEVELADGTRRSLRFTVVGSGIQSDLSVVMIRDVTAESERAAILEVKHKKEAVNAVAGALMHNVNQSLTVIMVHAQLMNLMLEKGLMKTGDVKKSLQDIVKETTQIAETLRNIDHPDKFVTEPYVGGVSILDIKRSSEQTETNAADRTPSACVWLESSYAALVNALMSALDAHEPSAALHSRRTAGYAAILAGKMGFSDIDVRKIRNCAALHDIGKLSIPEAILRKTSALDPLELEAMKKHSEFGYQLLVNVPFARKEAEVARSHHERFDGSGYPRGLAGRDIPPIARIVAVADAFDALRFGRLYHKASSPESIAEKIIAGGGLQFDPEVVRVFADCRQELIEAYKLDETLLRQDSLLA